MNIYVDGLDHLDEIYKERKDRDQRARALRREGWTVICKKWDFQGLGYGATYSLTANRPKGE